MALYLSSGLQVPHLKEVFQGAADVLQGPVNSASAEGSGMCPLLRCQQAPEEQGRVSLTYDPLGRSTGLRDNFS